LSIVELGSLLRHTKMGDKVKECLNYLPKLEIDTSLHAITRTVQRVMIEDPFHNHIYHQEFVNIAKKQVKAREPHQLVLAIPIFEPLPPQCIVSIRRAG
jgi:hypothetical protein